MGEKPVSAIPDRQVRLCDPAGRRVVPADSDWERLVGWWENRCPDGGFVIEFLEGNLDYDHGDILKLIVPYSILS